MSPASALPEWLSDAFGSLAAGDVEGWMQIYAPDAVHEFPFAPEGAVRRLEGRDKIAAYMGQLPERIRFGALSDVRVREAGDELIIEADGHHRRVADDTPFDIRYIWFITVRDGRVSHLRDYMGATHSQRLKQSGMHWAVNGTDAIITLRCAEDSSQWEAVCSHRHNQTGAA